MNEGLLKLFPQGKQKGFPELAWREYQFYFLKFDPRWKGEVGKGAPAYWLLSDALIEHHGESR